ncbi:cysteine-rich receptor-like protein kinase 43 [Rutidosis leptorrhynchoides]|uniref:cysteine-rich receptor-like protein kinase 43 n=1 Tax=Rutidosis leptorrhynchoides TaxID=125765 RepID=UPI003A99380A
MCIQLGKLRLQNGQDITIVSPLHMLMDKALMNEVSILVKLKHKNLVELVGYSIQGEIVHLVYHFATHATLNRVIHDPLSILSDWNKRYKILLEIARVLVYLHMQAPGPIIHGDIKSGNIVLDEIFYPKLSNFGVASKIEESDCTYVDQVYGTGRYMAPELRNKHCLSTKVDVYSFGVLVLETIFGYKVPANNKQLIEYVSTVTRYIDMGWKYLTQERISNPIDPKIDVDTSSIETFIKIGLSCTDSDPLHRPTKEEVVDMFLDESSVLRFLPKKEE